MTKQNMNATIRKDLFKVLSGELKNPTNAKTATEKMTEIFKAAKRQIESESFRRVKAIEDELSFAQLVLEGVYAEEKSPLRKIAEDYIAAETK